jgi:hypothetical protein
MLLVVRLQQTWNRVVEVRTSYFPIVDEQADTLKLDRSAAGCKLFMSSEVISKASLEKIIFTEFDFKTENGSYWGFDAVVNIMVEKESKKQVQFWIDAIQEQVMAELKAKNLRLKEAYKAVEALVS